MQDYIPVYSNEKSAKRIQQNQSECGNLFKIMDLV